MAENSRIEWTQATWNPVTGCTKISAGCEHCYAERMARRLCAMGHPSYENGFRVTLHPHMLEAPLKWSRPRMVFVNSMGDLFHPEVPERFIVQCLETMRQAPRHTFQILTKRSGRMLEISRQYAVPPNVWLGVTVERRDYAWRVDDLRRASAPVRFVSFEPLLGDLGTLNLEKIDWAIVGGESGPYSRPMEESWATALRDQCITHGVAFFFKQWGGTRRRAAGRMLQGRTWDEYPRHLLTT